MMWPRRLKNRVIRYELEPVPLKFWSGTGVECAGLRAADDRSSELEEVSAGVEGLNRHRVRAIWQS